MFLRNDAMSAKMEVNAKEGEQELATPYQSRRDG